MGEVFGNRVGSVGLESFDLGLVKTMGATVLGKSFVLNIEGLTPNIPVTFENPEQILRAANVPMMLIERDDPDFTVQRSHRGTTEYRVPAADAVEMTAFNGKIGYSAYVSKKAAQVCDITYTISVFDRYRDLANLFYKVITKPLLQTKAIQVVDSLGIVRSYSAFIEGSTKLDEVASLTNRVIGWGITLRVEAEIDIWDEVTESKIIRKVIINDGLMK